MKLYYYSKCSTCLNAIRYLDPNKIDYLKIDISISPPTKSELQNMLDFYEGEIRKLFNTSGQRYRELGLKDKIGGMSKAEAIEMLSKDGMLVKRPFMISDSFGLLGFKGDLSHLKSEYGKEF